MKLALGLTTVGLGALCVLATDAVAQFDRGDRTRVWPVLAERHDKNKDGKITADEYGRGEDKFRNWDSDGDGVLTKTDFVDRGPAGGNRGRGGERDRGRGGRQGGRRQRARGNRGTDISSNWILARFVARPADANRDSKITAAEWQRFCETLDCDQNGVIAREEFPNSENLSDRRFGMLRRALDGNGDGSVQITEFGATFKRLDADSSKELAGAEMGGDSRGRSGGRGGRGAAGVPQPGQPAPDFDLPLADQPAGAKEEVTIQLSSLAGKKPVALIFGSYT
ncbi:MAG: EF-hand domain-containing protein [Planctomycetota bacterium]|jgi:Ca2+-binding EF-hand superfamily protein